MSRVRVQVSLELMQCYILELTYKEKISFLCVTMLLLISFQNVSRKITGF